MCVTRSVSVFRSIVVCLTLFGTSCLGQAQTALVSEQPAQPEITFIKTCQSLGPFRIGTREAVWGADPLEAIGGFPGIPYDELSQFGSPFTVNATVKWKRHEVEVENTDNQSVIQLVLSYDELDQAYQPEEYGWPIRQYQSWIRAKLQNPGTSTKQVWIYSERILEFYVNGKHFFGGDFFAFKRAPVLASLHPGINVVDIRLVRDVRSMGGVGEAIVAATMRVKPAEAPPTFDIDHAIFPDLVNGKLPSRYISIPVRNPLSEWVQVRDCRAHSSEAKWMSHTGDIQIAPGQVRPIAMTIPTGNQISATLSGTICYKLQDSSRQEDEIELPFSLELQQRSLREASKFTFRHESGEISYAVLKPPSLNTRTTTMPLFVLLHGSGVDANDQLTRHSLDDMPDLEAFALFPTGMSPYSGDDWHLWGTVDTVNAINAVHDWIAEMDWNHTTVTTDRILISGHSNGGHGTWYFATHLPDRTLAATALSGYTSVENYIPFSMWREADPLQSSVLHTARNSYRHELLLDNLRGIPLLLQHGSADDNVPAFQSRLMSTLRSEMGMSPGYVEFADKPHWWDGAAATLPLRQFYRQNLYHTSSIKEPSQNFSIVIPNGVVESKFGIIVDQLLSPDRLGRVDVVVRDERGKCIWDIKSQNIRRLHFDFTKTHILPPHKIVFGADFELRPHEYTLNQLSCSKETGRSWGCSQDEWTTLIERRGRQRGALDAIMQSRGTFEIVSCLDDIDLATQISRNLFQYYGADANIWPCDQYADAKQQPGNLILVTARSQVPPSQLEGFPIAINDGSISLQTRPLGYEHVIPNQPGIGAIFLRPLDDEKLELIVWGSDERGLKQTARLVPTTTGGGQPDFVIVGPETGYKGCGGTLSLGFFDYNWNVSKASYLP